MLLLQKCLAATPGLKTDIALNGWPKDEAAFDGADAVLIFADGGKGHMALAGDRLAVLDRTLSKGAGLGLLHYAVIPTIEKGQKEFLEWAGGCYEIHWSVSPEWEPGFKQLPTHPVTRGVEPFTLRDEWYYHLRFVEGMKGVTPILVATPTAATLTKPDGPLSGNPHVRAAVARGEPQTVSWAYERPGGGRGFGLTGAHFHASWGNDDFRKLVLNAILWLAKMEVPAHGVVSKITPEDLAANLDPKPPRKQAAPAKQP